MPSGMQLSSPDHDMPESDDRSLALVLQHMLPDNLVQQ